MTRPLAEIEAELDDVEERAKLLRQRATALREERDLARVRDADAAPPHPPNYGERLKELSREQERVRDQMEQDIAGYLAGELDE